MNECREPSVSRRRHTMRDFFMLTAVNLRG